MIVCPAPSPPSQGSMTEAGPAPDRRYLLGDFVQFQCASGHLLKGAAVSSCQADGTWSAQTPLCEYFRSGKGVSKLTLLSLQAFQSVPIRVTFTTATSCPPRCSTRRWRRRRWSASGRTADKCPQVLQVLPLPRTASSASPTAPGVTVCSVSVAEKNSQLNTQTLYNYSIQY